MKYLDITAGGLVGWFAKINLVHNTSKTKRIYG